MGIVRRLAQELLSIPLDEIRLDQFEEFISRPQVTDEMLVGTLIVLALILVMSTLGYVMWVMGMVRRGRRFDRPQVILWMVGGLLCIDGGADFFVAALLELLGRNSM